MQLDITIPQSGTKQLLTVLGRVETERPCYVCAHCQRGQSPRAQELDVVGSEYSPGVRRMMGLVGSESSFEQGREQLELLAALEVTTKAVERQAEALGMEIAAAGAGGNSAGPGTGVGAGKGTGNPGAVHRDGWNGGADGGFRDGGTSW
jgi:hypothetical protein